MPITYAYDAQRHVLETKATGDVRLAQVEQYFETVRKEPWFPAPSLTDVRQASTDLASSEVRVMAERLRRLGPTLAGVPIAVLVDSDVAFGLVRMMGLLIDDAVDVRPFREADAAMAWLSEYNASHGRPSR